MTSPPVRNGLTRDTLSLLLAITAAVSFNLASLDSEAQPAAGKMPRVGFLVMARNPGIEDAFPQRLTELGYVEGRDVMIEWRSAEGRGDRMPALAAQVVQLGVDLIVAAGPEARLGAMSATSTIPIVVVGGSDPVAEGWAKSLARPGGNVTGLTVTHPDLAGKKLELLKETIPGLTRVAVISDVSRATSASQFRASTQAAAHSLSLDLRIIEVQQPGDLEGAFRQAVRDRRQAISVVETAMLFAHRAEIAERARKNRLPIIGEWQLSASAGFLMSYGADLSDLLRRAGTYVDKIIKGAKPGDLPVERPTKFEFVINLKTAKAIGLAIPPAVLSRADHVIQ
jgi:putative ABC transport system substrate-binding protein